jgi:hypothetical protein
VPGAAEEEVSDLRATFSALERLGARKLYRYIPPMDTHRGMPRFTIMAFDLG